MKSFLSFFPRNKKPRKAQLDAFDFIKKSKKKIILIQAPTGSGKTYIASSVAQAFGSGYILTATRALQDQYVRELCHEPFYADLRGRSNYTCNWKKVAANKAPCTLKDEGADMWVKCKKAVPGGWCDYENAVARAVSAPVTTFNFAAGMCFLNYHPKFKNEDTRDILIVDEAHDLDGQLTLFATLTIKLKAIRDYSLIPDNALIPEYSDVKSYVPWLEMLKDKALSTQSKLKAVNNLSLPQEEELNLLRKQISSALERIEDEPTNFVVEHIKKQKTVYDSKGNKVKEEYTSALEIKPILVADYFQDKIRPFGDVVLFLTATVPDSDFLMKTLGIAKDEYDFLELPFTFPKRNRPIIKEYVGEPLTMDTEKRVFPKIKDKVVELLNRHPNEKGIIHGHSHLLTQDLYDHLVANGFEDRIIYASQEDNEKDPNNMRRKLTEHYISNKPTVLLSPSMTQGIDLKGDFARFSIALKVPWPNTNNELIKAKKKAKEEWYKNTIITTILQMYGRHIRSDDDYGVFYLLDENFDKVLTWTKTPQYFKEAVTKEKPWWIMKKK